ncbi:MAG: hypothetical protein HN348_23340 [Proteobacteria bacterium]|nr:hypothetical protein [Pseudomonadota bacterium]
MRFGKEFSGTLRVEVFLVVGINDKVEQLRKIRAILDRVGPDRVDINTAVRPVPGGQNLKVSDAFLAEAHRILGERSSVITNFRRKDEKSWDHMVNDEQVLASLRRRPQTLLDLASSLDSHPESVLKVITCLSDAGKIEPQLRGDETFWLAVAMSSNQYISDETL